MIYFESIRCINKKADNLYYHQQRILKTTGLKICLSKIIKPKQNDLIKCKVIYNNNGIITIEYSKYKESILKSFLLVHDNNLEYTYKKLDRNNINKLKLNAIKRNIDDIIIIKNKLVTDTSISNIAILFDNNWITPKMPLLRGTMMEKMIKRKKLISKNIDINMLCNAKSFAIMNAMIGFKQIKNYKIIQDEI